MTVRTGLAASVDSRDGARAEGVRYLRSGEDLIFSVHHPAAEPRRDVAVLLCPPFGWEEVCAHRVLREWSRRVAQAGYASLNWTLPGCGDSSGSPTDEHLLDRWTGATEVAARWLREASGARSVVAIGLGLGGMLAYRAAASGAPIDGFVLWGVTCRGRDFIRQARAFSKLESSEFYIGLEPPPPASDEGALEAGGFLLSAATLESLKQLDLSTCPAPPAPLGALVLERDGVSADGRLLTALSGAAVDTTTAPGDGYAAMTTHPQTSVVPEDVFAATLRWLEAHSAPGAAASGLPPFDAELALPGAPGITETPFELRLEEGTVRGIVTRPGSSPARLCAVFLNAGAQRRIGPNRMWVEAARRWAGAGVASLRLDMLGIGESDGPTAPYARDMTLYDSAFPPRVIAALDELQRTGVADRFVLVGLCAGAYWALHAGLEDDRVSGIMMVNPVAVIWHDDVGAARDLRRVFTDRSWRLIRKNATRTRLRAVARMLIGAPASKLRDLRSRAGGPPSLEMEIKANLERWEEPTRRIMAMFAHREGLAMDLERSGAMARLQTLSNITIRRVPVNDHTLRPIAIQRLVHRELDDELRRILADPSALR